MILLQKNTLFIVVGTTAIGKTAKAIELAQHFDCEIISCDSRQFFKEMSIGTAVPGKEELDAVPHHFIQNKSIFESYNVGDFERETLEKLEELFPKNPVQVMVGGSGLYVDAIVKGFDDFPDIEPWVRENLRAEYEQKGIVFLQQKLRETDPFYYEKLKHENPQTLENPQRMMRFVEVSVGSGKPYSSFLNQKKNNRNFQTILIGLEADREVIYERINQRVDIMIESGLLEEAQKLYPNKHLNALQTVGYRELFDYFDGKTSLDFAIEEIKKNTRRFAKRQLTWFKRNPDILWFDYKTSVEEIVNRAEH
ncbi:MAG: tRNA (adenosine(37)-N6)-dimethylallyltransferase MiaA [Flavobacteriaceae bacterium]